MKIQKWLIPGKKNNYHPHILRPLGLSLMVASLLFVNVSYNFTEAKKFQVLGYATNISASEIISLSNQQRAAGGLSGLSYNAKLTQAAQAKAQDMLNKNYWSHNSPDGLTPWYFITNAGYSYTTAGENLAKDFDTSSGVVNGWMNSSGHRANIMSTSFKETGVAVVNGVLQGSETTLVVAMYAAPKAAAAAPAPAAAKPKSSTTAKPAAQAPAPVPAVEAPVQKPAPEPAPAQAAPVKAKPKATLIPPPVDPTYEQELKAALVKEQRTWAQNASLFIISTILLIAVLKHTIVWRTERRGWQHVWLRAHPAAQYGLLFIALAANVASGVGAIL